MITFDTFYYRFDRLLPLSTRQGGSEGHFLRLGLDSRSFGVDRRRFFLKVWSGRPVPNLRDQVFSWFWAAFSPSRAFFSLFAIRSLVVSLFLLCPRSHFFEARDTENFPQVWLLIPSFSEPSHFSSPFPRFPDQTSRRPIMVGGILEQRFWKLDPILPPCAYPLA